jgi:adenylate kinase
MRDIRTIEIEQLEQMSKEKDIEKQEKHVDLEIKDATLIFNIVWSEIDSKFPKTEQCFPKEIIWLGGAPGAGKGTNTAFISKEREFTSKPIVVSDLLNSPEANKIKDSGGMVGDREVISILMGKLLEKEYESGVIIDGFPRTQVQVEFLKMFYNKMISLKHEYQNTTFGHIFRYPIFRITVLYVTEKVSVERQLKRGRESQMHNDQVQNENDKIEIRSTDYDEELARNRYRVFKEQTYTALTSLKKHFQYHLVDAEGGIVEVEENIAKEFVYQSSLELDVELFEELRHIPLSSEICIHTRQDLIKRLEDHYNIDKELFHTIIRIIEEDYSPIIERHTASGFVIINTSNAIFDNPIAVRMLTDILCERGFKANVDARETHIPYKVDPNTNLIECKIKKHIAIHISFPITALRR